MSRDISPRNNTCMVLSDTTSYMLYPALLQTKFLSSKVKPSLRIVKFHFRYSIEEKTGDHKRDLNESNLDFARVVLYLSARCHRGF
jgi:hypothetical protein